MTRLYHQWHKRALSHSFSLPFRLRRDGQTWMVPYSHCRVHTKHRKLACVFSWSIMDITFNRLAGPDPDSGIKRLFHTVTFSLYCYKLYLINLDKNQFTTYWKVLLLLSQIIFNQYRSHCNQKPHIFFHNHHNPLFKTGSPCCWIAGLLH